MAPYHVLNPGEGRKLDFFDVSVLVKATSAETNGAFSLIEGVWQPGGFGPLPHIHTQQEESFYVLSGEFDFIIGEEKLRAEAGSFLVVPRGIVHSFAAAGDSPARLMFLHTPGLEGFFLELAQLPQNRPPDPVAVRALMNRWGMETPA